MQMIEPVHPQLSIYQARTDVKNCITVVLIVKYAGHDKRGLNS